MKILKFLGIEPNHNDKITIYLVARIVDYFVSKTCKGKKTQNLHFVIWMIIQFPGQIVTDYIFS